MASSVAWIRREATCPVASERAYQYFKSEARTQKPSELIRGHESRAEMGTHSLWKMVGQRREKPGIMQY